MAWHDMWGAGAAPKGPDLGEARAEATRGVAGMWQGAHSRFLGRGEVVVELGAPRRWRRWRRLGALRRWRRWRRLGAPRRWRRLRLQQIDAAETAAGAEAASGVAGQE
jgi:hypothetical protein